MTKILVLLYGIRRVIYANHTPYAIFIRLDSVVRKIPDFVNAPPKLKLVF